MATTLMTKEEVGERMQLTPDEALKALRRLGCPVLRVGHRTTRVRESDFDEAFDRLARDAAPVVVITRPDALTGKTARAGKSTGPRKHR